MKASTEDLELIISVWEKKLFALLLLILLKCSLWYFSYLSELSCLHTRANYLSDAQQKHERC